MEVETGRRHVQEPSKLQRIGNTGEAMFHIKQGLRRRHPGSVLHQFDGVYNTTSKAHTMYEQALMFETERAELPEEFRPTGDSSGLINQVGLVQTANANFKKSQKKLERLLLAGV